MFWRFDERDQALKSIKQSRVSLASSNTPTSAVFEGGQVHFLHEAIQLWNIQQECQAEIRLSIFCSVNLTDNRKVLRYQEVRRRATYPWRSSNVYLLGSLRGETEQRISEGALGYSRRGNPIQIE